MGKNGIFCVLERTRHAKDDVTFNEAYNPNAQLGPHENPPFIPGFFVLKIRIDDTNIIKIVRETF